MTKETSEVLLIFVKNPVKGRVKTRLAKAVGETKALHVYQELLKITKRVTSLLPVDKQVWYSDAIVKDDLWDEERFTKYKQKGEDLGIRMSAAFQQAFEHSYKKVVIIGSDCPDLNATHLKKAFQALDTHDVVIGPAEDGGYYLLGMTHFIPTLFEGITWSEATVFDQTIHKLRSRAKTWHVLPVLNDIDDINDLKRSGVFSDKNDL
ncbi:TIGR04282 family arsenosugar biosynthesis glycosyltransferase [Gracilimonas amylolytica]|uniref:TIGR04282 family arsenosugar biosynthesis glycosyltransferase n=1 Tax=Gracilimonas amylolytica TaxID=1749045 RepID=UPI000CD8D308|nr:TIGR04282 family arsenosugar biosynthesis glycosyltransferase [Gracilimonas amylolytica]